MFKASADMLKVRSFFEDMPDGSHVDYDDIEKGTGIKMDDKGKGIMRSALNGIKREYYCRKGVGIVLDSPDNAMIITAGRGVRISNAIKKANKTSKNMLIKHYEKMDEKDRERLSAFASLLGAVTAVSSGLKKIYKQPAEVKKVTKEEVDNIAKLLS